MAELRVCCVTEPWYDISTGQPWYDTSTGQQAVTANTTAVALLSVLPSVSSTVTAYTQMAQAASSAGHAMQTLNTAWPSVHRPSPEEIDALIAEHRAEIEERKLARQVADARATQLLFAILTEDERESYAQRGWFEVQGSAGGWWRIRRNGQAGNVDELERPGGDPVASWCCHPPGGLPDADAHAAQLLQLVTDERGFRETGNRTPRYRLPVRAA